MKKILGILALCMTMLFGITATVHAGEERKGVPAEDAQFAIDSIECGEDDNGNEMCRFKVTNLSDEDFTRVSILMKCYDGDGNCVAFPSALVKDGLKSGETAEAMANLYCLFSFNKIVFVGYTTRTEEQFTNTNVHVNNWYETSYENTGSLRPLDEAIRVEDFIDRENGAVIGNLAFTGTYSGKNNYGEAFYYMRISNIGETPVDDFDIYLIAKDEDGNVNSDLSEYEILALSNMMMDIVPPGETFYRQVFPAGESMHEMYASEYWLIQGAEEIHEEPAEPILLGTFGSIE